MIESKYFLQALFKLKGIQASIVNTQQGKRPEIFQLLTSSFVYYYIFWRLICKSGRVWWFDSQTWNAIKNVFSIKIYVFWNLKIEKISKIFFKTNEILHNSVVRKYVLNCTKNSRDSENIKNQVFTHMGYPKTRRRRDFPPIFDWFYKNTPFSKNTPPLLSRIFLKGGYS